MWFEGKWMQFEDMLSEVSQAQKHKTTFSFICERSRDKYIHKNKHDHEQT
jgi:hypothetical protein